MLAYSYHTMVRGLHSRTMARKRIFETEEKAKEHADWYEGNTLLLSSYNFLAKVFDSWV
jgi:hypothetical protein